MTYTPALGYALIAIAVGCFLLDAPPWLFLATGASALAIGFVGLRQVRRVGGDHDDDGNTEHGNTDQGNAAQPSQEDRP